MQDVTVSEEDHFALRELPKLRRSSVEGVRLRLTWPSAALISQRNNIKICPPPKKKGYRTLILFLCDIIAAGGHVDLNLTPSTVVWRLDYGLDDRGIVRFRAGEADFFFPSKCPDRIWVFNEYPLRNPDNAVGASLNSHPPHFFV